MSRPNTYIFNFHPHIFSLSFFLVYSRGHFRIVLFSFFIFYSSYSALSVGAASLLRSSSQDSRVGDQPPFGFLCTISSFMALQGNYLLTTCWCGAPGIAVQAGQRSFGAVLFSSVRIFVFFSGCRAASAVKLRVPPTRSPASGGRERAGGGRGGWWRGWWFGTQALLSPGVMRPCRLASDGYSFSLVVGSPSSCRAMFAFVALIFLRFLGPSDAATSVAASLEQ